MRANDEERAEGDRADRFAQASGLVLGAAKAYLPPERWPVMRDVLRREWHPEFDPSIFAKDPSVSRGYRSPSAVEELLARMVRAGVVVPLDRDRPPVTWSSIVAPRTPSGLGWPER